MLLVLDVFNQHCEAAEDLTIDLDVCIRQEPVIPEREYVFFHQKLKAMVIEECRYLHLFPLVKDNLMYYVSDAVAEHQPEARLLEL